MIGRFLRSILCRHRWTWSNRRQGGVTCASCNARKWFV